jgi:hypothetical protein
MGFSSFLNNNPCYLTTEIGSNHIVNFDGDIFQDVVCLTV